MNFWIIGGIVAGILIGLGLAGWCFSAFLNAIFGVWRDR